jgi:hypothetical protein
MDVGNDDRTGHSDIKDGCERSTNGVTDFEKERNPDFQQDAIFMLVTK